MQRAFPEFIRRYQYAEEVDLKLGIYPGPCFAVTANGVLDYFGQTVNVAARLQAQAGPGDLVLPEDLAEAAAAGGWLGDSLVAERYQATLKGVDGPIGVARVRLGAVGCNPPPPRHPRPADGRGGERRNPGRRHEHDGCGLDHARALAA